MVPLIVWIVFLPIKLLVCVLIACCFDLGRDLDETKMIVCGVEKPNGQVPDRLMD
jgi:hypothetical protein